MNILLTNIQCIKSGAYSFPDTGIVQIKGDNSNGKSILPKAIGAIVNLKILDEEERQSLINDAENSGSILIENNGMVLYVVLTRERAGCSVTLRRANGEDIRRTFREGGIEELIYEFGFRCYGNNSVCLQLYETFGPMPFVNTQNSLNGEIVESITEDKVAKEFLTNFKEITYPMAKQYVKGLTDQITQEERLRSAITLFDYVAYEENNKKLSDVYAKIQYLQPLDLVPLDLVPDTGVLSLKPLNLVELSIPQDVPAMQLKPLNLRQLPIVEDVKCLSNFVDLSEIIGEIDMLQNGKCPTCGRPWVSE